VASRRSSKATPAPCSRSVTCSVVPGVVLLSLVMQALAGRPALQARLGAAPCIDEVKFLAPVGPGTTLHVTLREHGAGVAFELRREATVVARGRLSDGAAR